MSIEGDGILKQMNTSGTHIYSKLTPKDIEDSITKMFLNKVIQPVETCNVYWFKGYETYNFVIMFSNSFTCSWWFNYFKYKKSLYKYDIYLNVIRKHSLYKVLVEKLEKEQLGSNYKFTLLKGTQVVSWHYNIKALNIELAKLVKEADLEDLKRKQEREIRIANYGK